MPDATPADSSLFSSLEFPDGVGDGRYHSLDRPVSWFINLLTV